MKKTFCIIYSSCQEQEDLKTKMHYVVRSGKTQEKIMNPSEEHDSWADDKKLQNVFITSLSRMLKTDGCCCSHRESRGCRSEWLRNLQTAPFLCDATERTNQQQNRIRRRREVKITDRKATVLEGSIQLWGYDQVSSVVGYVCLF